MRFNRCLESARRVSWNDRGASFQQPAVVQQPLDPAVKLRRSQYTDDPDPEHELNMGWTMFLHKPSGFESVHLQEDKF